jgi:hypothetical protein
MDGPEIWRESRPSLDLGWAKLKELTTGGDRHAIGSDDVGFDTGRG